MEGVTNLRAERVKDHPYAPSWVNQVNNLVDQLPVPAALIYLPIGLAFITALTVIRWREGVYPVGTLYIPDIILGSTGLFFVALVHYLDAWASKKLGEYRWAVEASDDQYESLSYQLATLPARPTALMGLFMLAFGLVSLSLIGESYAFLRLNITSVSGGMQLANFLFSWWVFGALSYHAFHQLKVGSIISTRHLKINLFQLDPLYAFAGLALRTAVGWLIMAYAWSIITPTLLQQPAIAVTVIFMQVVALLTFLIPLLGAHYLLEHKKGELQRDIGGRVESVINELNDNLEKRDSEELAKLNTMLSSLMMAEERLVKTPTWPWRPGTLSWLVTAVLLPLGLWLLQVLFRIFFCAELICERQKEETVPHVSLTC